jgi:ParB-like chromosome segregation protein Spo0J
VSHRKGAGLNVGGDQQQARKKSATAKQREPSSLTTSAAQQRLIGEFPDRSQITRLITDIRVGKRHRKDLGDIAALAASIAKNNLLHAIVVTPDNKLIAGQRRLRAYESLGKKRIPVRVVDIDAIALGEYAENAERKDFTMSEAVAIKRELEPIERTEAKKRQAAARHRNGAGNLPTPKGRASDKAARAAGLARRTLEKAEAVVDAAEAEPERFGKLLEDMDRTGRVNGVYKRLLIARQAAQIKAEPPPLPGKGPYRVIVSDPPWPYEIRREDPSHRRPIHIRP